MIIEFAGLPRSGKSTSIGVVKNYFSRSGFKTKLVAEGARSCPFSNRHRVEFACWTANQALSAVMEASLDDPATLVLQDRGLFDALAFIHLMEIEGIVEPSRAHQFFAYFGDSLWLRKVDLVFLFTVKPEIALTRDLAAILKAPPGVITNVETMGKLRRAYDFTEDRVGVHIKNIIRIDTTSVTEIDSMRLVIEAIDDHLRASHDE